MLGIGLFLTGVGSPLPVGRLQTWASVDQGYWYARSKEFLGTPLMQTLRWLRVPGGHGFRARRTSPGGICVYDPIQANRLLTAILAHSWQPGCKRLYRI
jgi:hypothetical protein